MLTKLKVKGLFDRFDYEIEFKNEGLTIITGPNGYGKSTILKLINALSLNKMYSLVYQPFNLIEFSFSNNIKLKIEKMKDSMIKINEIKIPLPSERTRRSGMRRRFPSFLERITPYEYLDRRTGEILREDDPKLLQYLDIKNLQTEDPFFIDLLNDFLTTQKQENVESDIAKVVAYVNDAHENLGKIKYIKEQRLIEEKEDAERTYGEKIRRIYNVIESIPEKLKIEIDKILKEHSSLSSKLDSSYPNRLFAAKRDMKEEDYKKNINEINANQEKLKKYELAEITTISNVIFNKEFSTALSIYFDDSKTKYKVFEYLIEKLDTFVDIVNDKLTFKKIIISKEFGLKLVDISNGSELKLGELSSGEQEIVVLFYQLIFETPNAMLLLIDEPEISLHIAWQKELLEDFRKIVKLKQGKINIIIATHSPQVINHNWDLQVDLGELYGK